MKKLNPVKTAKVFGWIMVILGILGLLTAFSPETGIPPYFSILMFLVTLVGGILLIQNKIIGAYLYGISIFLNIIAQVFIKESNFITVGGIGIIIGGIIIAFQIYIFYLFIANKKSFS